MLWTSSRSANEWSALLPASEAKRRLIAERERSARTPGTVIDRGAKLERNTDNWVRAWLDPGYRVVHADGQTYALRAITDGGQFIWMIHHPKRRYAFHATRDRVEDAFLQAQEARRCRKAIASRWPEIVALRRRLLRGEERLVLTLDDARRAGLCEPGIQGFFHRFGLSGRDAFNGRAMAALSFLDRQVAYALFAAHLRTQERFRVPDDAGDRYDVRAMHGENGSSVWSAKRGHSRKPWRA